MKNLTKIIVVAAFVGTLGVTGLSRVVFAKQPQSLSSIAPQHHKTTQVAEASDGDGETNDDAQEEQETINENANQQDHKNEATRPKSSIQVQEAEDGDRETNDDGK